MSALARRSFVSVSTVFAVCALVVGGTQLSCSSEDDNGASGGSAGTGGKGSGATGGKGGTGGSGATGGTGASPGDGGDPYACFASQVTNPDPGGSVAAGADCCDTFGTCTAEASVPASLRGSLGHDDCTASPSLLCAPKDPASFPALPGGKLPTCHLTFGAVSFEGRCLPRCFTLGNPSARSLDQGDCSEAVATQLGISLADVVCAPCYNPLDATSTGSCSQFGDAPVEAVPAAFTECGIYPEGAAPAGFCVPQELVANVSADTSLIPQDTCAAGMLCAPKNKVENPNLCFAKCEQSPTLGGPAACVPTYLVEAPGSPGVGLSVALGQVTCAAGETCTPCVSPLNGEETGACKN